MMMASIKTVVVLLVSLQLTQQASISNEIFTETLSNPIDSKLTSYPSYNVPSVVKYNNYEFIIDHGSATNSRIKREDNQDPDLDAEITSNDPELFSSKILMPIKNDEDDDIHKHHGSSSLDEDVDAETSNKLSVLKGNTEQDNETENKVKKIESDENGNRFLGANHDATTHKPTDEEHSTETSLQTSIEAHDSAHTDLGGSQPQSQDSYLEAGRELESTNAPIQSQDDSHVNGNNDNNNSDEPDVMSDEGYLTPNPLEQENIKENLLEEERDKGEVKQNGHLGKEDDGVSVSNAHLSANDMQENEDHLHHNDEHVTKSTAGSEVGTPAGDSAVIVSSLEKPNEEVEDVDTGVFTNENQDTEEDGTFSRLQESNDDAVESEEGSGDVEGITTAPHGTLFIDDNEEDDGKVDNTMPKETSIKVDNIDFNIDSEPTSEKTLEEEKENEEEHPISDPTEGVSVVDNNSKVLHTSEENTDDDWPLSPTTENSLSIDPSKTYDPNTIVNPFHIDRGLDISKALEKALGIIDHFEITTGNDELEGSGGFPDNETEDDAVEDIDPLKLASNETISDSDDEHVKEKGITELPIITKHQPVLLSPVPGIANNEETRNTSSLEESTAQTQVANVEVITSKTITDLSIETAMGKTSDDTADVTEIIGTTNEPGNEYGAPLIPEGDKKEQMNENFQDASADDSDRTSSSSTGSFIVLGAILVTIVALLLYSFIKSRRQKQRIVRRSPPEENDGTELKEKLSLLAEENGHSFGNGNVEAGKLLNTNEETDKNDAKDGDSFSNSKIVNGGNDAGNEPTKIPNTEDPNELTEVKVNKPNTASPNTLDNPNQLVSNGVGLENSVASPSAGDKTSLVHGTKPEITKAKMFIDTDSIPKTPIVIVKRGPANFEI